MATVDLPLPDHRPRTLLDRALAPVSKVRDGEGAGAVLLAANVFLL